MGLIQCLWLFAAYGGDLLLRRCSLLMFLLVIRVFDVANGLCVFLSAWRVVLECSDAGLEC